MSNFLKSNKVKKIFLSIAVFMVIFGVVNCKKNEEKNQENSERFSCVHSSRIENKITIENKILLTGNTGKSITINLLNNPVFLTAEENISLGNDERIIRLVDANGKEFAFKNNDIFTADRNTELSNEKNFKVYFDGQLQLKCKY